MGQYVNGTDEEIRFSMLKLQGVIGKMNLNPLAEG